MKIEKTSDEKLDVLSEEEERSKAWFVRKAVKKYLEDYENAKPTA